MDHTDDTEKNRAGIQNTALCPSILFRGWLI